MTHTQPWLDHWLEACRDLSNLTRSHPMMDAVIHEIDGRMIRVGDQWLADFASCNYLGFDLDREIIEAIPGYLEAWGIHPSWSRLLGSPVLYEQIERQLAELLGCEDSLVLPTITHIHASVIPLRGSRPSRRAAQRRARPHPARLHGRREQHDRQRARRVRIRRRRTAPRSTAVHRRRPWLRGDRRARRKRALPLRAQGQRRGASLRRDLRQRG